MYGKYVSVCLRMHVQTEIESTYLHLYRDIGWSPRRRRRITNCQQMQNIGKGRKNNSNTHISCSNYKNVPTEWVIYRWNRFAYRNFSSVFALIQHISIPIPHSTRTPSICIPRSKLLLLQSLSLIWLVVVLYFCPSIFSRYFIVVVLPLSK